MYAWEAVIARALHRFGLDSIKRKILVFALLATLIPSLTMGTLSYWHNKQVLMEQTSEELRMVNSHTVRELDLWLKERLHQMRVFSSSREVSENAEKRFRADASAQALRRLKDYLEAVRGQYADYEDLMLVDTNAQVIATSAETAGSVKLPADWLKRAEADAPVLGEAYWDETRHKAVMSIAVPVRASDGRVLGVLAATLNFGVIEDLLKSLSFGRTGQVSLIGPDGTVMVSSRPSAPAPNKARLPAETLKALFDQKSAQVEFADPQGKGAIGTLKKASQLEWGVLAKIDREEAFARTIRIRNLTLLIASGLLVAIGLTAYFLGLTIVRPLDRLARGAAKVADGYLNAEVAVVTRGEVGYLTEIFNSMVARLREDRHELDTINKALSEKNEELQTISFTDGLTGLQNRKHLMATLATEAARGRRHKHAFAVLMIDIDHFKQYNDTYGHLAGDALLIKIGSIFRHTIRSVDYAARYGGEEFLIMLPESEGEEALRAAERVRAQVEEGTSGDERVKGSVTISIGVAVFSRHGETPEAIIASADAALYQAKRLGRNRVVLADGPVTQ